MKKGDIDNKFGYQNIDPAANDNEGPKRALELERVEMIEFLRKKKADRSDLYGRLILK